MNYRVNIPVFEGPLDLLLFLVRKNEIDIYDIPIALITRQYLETIELMRQLDLDVASEFIWMASYLIQLKVRMMLPQPEEDLEDVEDPRTALALQLELYQAFKETAAELSDIEESSRKRFPLQNLLLDTGHAEPEEVEWDFGDLRIYDLMTALQRVIEEMPKQTYHEVIREEGTLEQQMDFVRDYLSRVERTSFFDLMMQTQKRFLVILTFLAILELSKRREIRLYQIKNFQDIWIYKQNVPVE